MILIVTNESGWNLFCHKESAFLTLSWRRPLSYRNQSIDLQSKSMDWFLYDNGLRHERVKVANKLFMYIKLIGIELSKRCYVSDCD